MSKRTDDFSHILSMLFRPHPWHGVSPGEDAPNVVKAYVEIVPTSTVKLELDKASGHLSVDRPQRFSSLCPTLYGFIPQTYCGKSIGEFCAERTGRKRMQGDGDPLDICILTKSTFAHGDVFVRVRPIGGLRMIDKGQADDKIIAVLVDDITYGGVKDISELPGGELTQLQHYLLSYKQLPGERKRTVKIPDVYGAQEAHEVIRRSRADYDSTYGSPEDRLEALRKMLQESVKTK